MMRVSMLALLLVATAANAREPVYLECAGIAQVCVGAGADRSCSSAPPAVPRSLLEVGEGYVLQRDELKFLEFPSRCTQDARAVTCVEPAASGEIERIVQIDRRSGRITYNSFARERTTYEGACEVRKIVTSF